MIQDCFPYAEKIMATLSFLFWSAFLSLMSWHQTIPGWNVLLPHVDPYPASITSLLLPIPVFRRSYLLFIFKSHLFVRASVTLCSWINSESQSHLLFSMFLKAFFFYSENSVCSSPSFIVKCWFEVVTDPGLIQMGRSSTWQRLPKTRWATNCR